MKKVLLITASFLLTASLQAQITLNSANAPKIAICQKEDSANRVKIAGAILDLSVKTNGTWDFTTAVDSYSFYNFNAPASNSTFPNATYNIPGSYSFAGNLNYISDVLYNVETAGILIYGEHLDRQSLPIGALTGDTKDSLVFLNQDVIYSVQEMQVKYPATMNSSWSNINKFITKFELTVTGFGLNKTPGERRSTRTINYKVVGWGKARVNDDNGDSTAYMNVLQIEEVRSTVDSFFLGGSPAPPTLLNAFGLTQGQTSSQAHRNLVRAGEQKELVQAIFEDGTFTTMTSCEIHKQRLPKPVGINKIRTQDIKIYPNPVTNNSFTVKMNGINGNITYQLYSITGQEVAEGNVLANGNVILKNNIPSGTYYLKLATDKSQHGMKQINVIN